jgi:hypothetical protein
MIVHGRLAAATGSGVKQKRHGIRKLGSGRRQATYYGYPLYQYKGDHKPGQTNGAFREQRKPPRGTWCIITTSGNPCPTGY